MSQLYKPGTYDRNGVPFSALLNQNKQIVRESSKEHNSTVVQNRAVLTDQSSQQIFWLGLNDGINSTEESISGMPNTNTKLVKTAGTNTGLLITVSNKQQKKKIKGSARKRFDRLLKEGIPHEEARSLCRLPWIILEKMLLSKARNMVWVNHCEQLQGFNKNSEVSPGIHERNSEVTARVSSTVPNYQGDKTTVTQKSQNEIGAPRAPTQNPPQTFSREAQSMGMKSTEVRDSGTLNSNRGSAAIVISSEADTTNTENSWNWKKISRTARKRYHRLKEEGIPQDEARRLCRMPSRTLDEILLNYPRKRTNSDDQGPGSKNLKTSETGGHSSDVFSRVGIANSKPMSEDQMNTLHRNLNLAIIEQCSAGKGPRFLGYSHKAGWVLVTCENQRSKEWLVHEVPYQEPWPEAQLYIIPDEELPEPPRAVTFIPEAVAPSVEEALRLLKMQNFGLNTELWKVRYEKVENEGRTLSFTLDDPSADVLREQNCQATIDSKMLSFKIKGQYRPYNPKGTSNQVLASSNQGAMPGSSKPQVSQSLGDKSCHKATITSKDIPSSASRGHLPLAAVRVQPTQRQDVQPFAEKTPFALDSGRMTREDPTALSMQQSVPQPREFEALPIIQNSSHGRAQKDQRGPVIGEPSTYARGTSQAARGAVQPILDSQFGTPFIQGRSVGTVLGSDGSVFVMRRSSQRDSPRNRPSFDHGRTSAINQNTYSTQGPGGMYEIPNHGEIFALKGGTATEQAPQTKGEFRGRPSQNSLSDRTSLTQRCRERLTEFSQPGFSALSHAGESPNVGRTSTLNGMDPPSVKRTLVHNGREAAIVSERNSFSGPSQTRCGFGGRPIIMDSKSGTVFGQEKHSEADIASHHASDLTNQEPSQFDVLIIRESQRKGDQGNVVDLTVTDSDDSDREETSDGKGGYHTWIIEDPKTYGTRLQNMSVTGTVTSATGLERYRQLSHDQVGYSNRTVSPEFTSGMATQSRSYEAWIIESQSSVYQDGGTVNEQEKSRREVLPQSEGFQHIELDNLGRFQGNAIDREPMSVRVYEAGVQNSKDCLRHIELDNLGRFQGNAIDREPLSGRAHEGVQNHKDERPFEGRTLSDEESRRRELLSQQSGFQSQIIETESQPFHGSRGTVAFQDSRSHNRLLPHLSDAFQSQNSEFESHGRSFHRDRLSDTDSRVLSLQTSRYEDQDHRSLFRGKLKDRELDRSPPRCGYDTWTIEEPKCYVVPD